jgi:hypothetical protein
MTVLNDNIPYVQYIGDGVTTFFAFTFEVKDYSGILVYVDDVPTDYQRSDTGVTIDPAPADGAVIDIYRATSLTQEADFSAQEAFPPGKTEDAVDKLILLKQEMAFNLAAMNLLAQPFLSNVTITNSAGNNAVIPLWDENKAGVFAGEAAENIPNAGDVVAKPENFVYMQWGQPAQLQILTTTPYPVVTREGLRLGGDLDSGAMRPIPQDAMDLGIVTGNGTLIQILIDGGTFDDAMDLGVVSGNGTLVQILLSIGPYDDAMDLGVSAGNGNLVSKLVQGYHPDQGLRLGGNLDPGLCSMTPV